MQANAQPHNAHPHKKQLEKTLTNKSGDELKVHFNNLMPKLAKEKGIPGQIFTKSRCKITDPVKDRSIKAK